MKKAVLSAVTFISLLFPFYSGNQLFAQNPAVVISSYYIAADPRDEWTELLVTGDNVCMNGWTLQDNIPANNTWQPAITFNNPSVWNHLRSGTIIVIWHRMEAVNGSAHPEDNSNKDGYIEVSANDPKYFSGGMFGASPLFAGPTLNITSDGDLLCLKDDKEYHVHALGHGETTGPSWTATPLPKLNHKAIIPIGQALSVCPGADITEYGFLFPQNGTNWTNAGTMITRGLPNACSDANINQAYWRKLRELPLNPSAFTGVLNNERNAVHLHWNPVFDIFPADSTAGYMILRCRSACSGSPSDGQTYRVGERMGTNQDTVIALTNSTLVTDYTDSINIPCGGDIYYRIYSYRYSTDELNGNGAAVSRGRAYSENAPFEMIKVSAIIPQTPLTITSDKNYFCAADDGNIILTANGGEGNLLEWYEGSCGGFLIGTTTTNSLTIPSPDHTTDYYVQWASQCGISECKELTVTVIPEPEVAINIFPDQNPVCTGTPVEFTATTINTGDNPHYQWKVNGINTGTNRSVFTYIPAEGDVVTAEVISNAECAPAIPVVSAPVVMHAGNAVPVTVYISSDPGNIICQGTNVIYKANTNNGGTEPQYEWFLNGKPVLTNSQTWSYHPSDGDVIWCRVTSNSDCATNNPAMSDTVSTTVIAKVQPKVEVSADPKVLCEGAPSTIFTFSAASSDEGTAPLYEWFMNGISAVTGNSPIFQNVALQGDVIFCRMTSSVPCPVSNPVESDHFQILTEPAPVVKLTDDDYLCTGNPVVLDGGEGYISYLWQDGSTERIFTATKEGKYTVTVTTPEGCTGSGSVLLKDCEGKIVLPEAFTPNGDGLNDIFRPISSQEGLLSFEMHIYNRWGETICYSTNISFGWDGRMNGAPAPAGSYYWKIIYRLSQGGLNPEHILQGNVLLIR